MKILKHLSAVLMLSFAFISCEKAEDPTIGESTIESDPTDPGDPDPVNCQPKTVKLLAGKNTNAGSIIISNDNTNLYVAFTTTGGWVMKHTHLYAGPLSGLPVNKVGNPKIGTFPFQTAHNPYVTTFTYTIPLSNFTGQKCIIVAAHAELLLIGPGGEVKSSQTGWGSGPQITPGKSWAMYVDYCICKDSNPPS